MSVVYVNVSRYLVINKIYTWFEKTFKKSIMKNHSLLQVQPHLTTTNIYVQKAIIVRNIDKINTTLNSRNGLNITNSLYWQIVKLKKSQKAILKSINQKINQIEQGSFPFGG